jgi:hypothetical protein
MSQSPAISGWTWRQVHHALHSTLLAESVAYFIMTLAAPVVLATQSQDQQIWLKFGNCLIYLISSKRLPEIKVRVFSVYATLIS